MNIQSIVPTSLKLKLTVTLLVLLAACDGPAPSTPVNVLQSTSSTPEQFASFSPSPSSTSTSTASPSPTSTNTPTPTAGPKWNSWYPLRDPIEVLTSDFTREEFQDLIIFNAEWPSFVNTWMRFEDRDTLLLIAFSPDGQRAGALLSIEYNSSIYLPSDPSEKTLLVEYGVNFDHPAVQGIELPPECYPQEGATGRFIPCSRFQFSPDGKYLGFFYNAPNLGGGCGQGIIIMETQTGEFDYHLPELSGFIFDFLDNGKALVKTGHCEGGEIALVDLNHRTERDLGDSGGLYWNIDRTAFAVDTNPYMGDCSSIWGFNLQTNRFFMSIPETRQIDVHPVWTPDSRYLLYQHRTYTRNDDNWTYALEYDQSRQIILVDAQTGTQRILLSDPAYDFHLGSERIRDEWYGDWIMVRRVAFTPEVITADNRNQLYACRIQGYCPPPVELFSLNWKTGELVPWDEMVQAGLVPDLDSMEEPGPDLTQDPVYEFGDMRLYQGPDENSVWLRPPESDGWRLIGTDLESSPIYTHPDGLYAYYVGIDGKTLWMVPAEGDPILWVIEGENYFYVPPLPEEN